MTHVRVLIYHYRCPSWKFRITTFTWLSRGIVVSYIKFLHVVAQTPVTAFMAVEQSTIPFYLRKKNQLNISKVIFQRSTSLPLSRSVVQRGLGMSVGWPYTMCAGNSRVYLHAAVAIGPDEWHTTRYVTGARWQLWVSRRPRSLNCRESRWLDAKKSSKTVTFVVTDTDTHVQWLNSTELYRTGSTPSEIARSLVVISCTCLSALSPFNLTFTFLFTSTRQSR